MTSADFYPHPIDGVSLRETHISWAILMGPFVYKIKKPVDLGFLDFTKLEKRGHYCRREVELNRRLTRDIYLGVVTITQSESGFQLDGEGETVETAVKMRQLASRDSLTQRLQRNSIDPSAIDRRLYRVVEAASCVFLEQHRTLFAEHVQSGRIRDGHGDAHSTSNLGLMLFGVD